MTTTKDNRTAYHARFRAANGRIVWTTESYTRRRPAEQAIDLMGVWAPWATAIDVDERRKP